MYINNRVITTATSNIFFPFLLNFIGSINNNYKNHPKIIVYSLGLNFFFIKYLESIKGVEVIKIPKFSQFWNSCYSWKIWIFKNNLYDNQLHIDCGSTVLSSLEGIFDEIDKKGYFLVSQELKLKNIIPKEYYDIFSINKLNDNNKSFSGGIIGFNKKSDIINKILNISYSSMKSGLCLGFSKNEKGRNKGKNKSIFIRNCNIFRCDQTILNILFYKYINDININNIEKYAYCGTNKPNNNCIIHNHRINVKYLQYMNKIIYNKKNIYTYIGLFISKQIIFYIYIKNIIILIFIKIRK